MLDQSYLSTFVFGGSSDVVKDAEDMIVDVEWSTQDFAERAGSRIMLDSTREMKR